MKKLKIILFLTSPFFLLIPGVFAQERWEAPAEADTLENPYRNDDADAIASGKDLYTMLCASCHGDRGDGTGAAGQTWDPPPADFTNEEVQHQSDGAIFWKISEGNPPGRIPYKQLLEEEEVWQLVIYLRQF